MAIKTGCRGNVNFDVQDDFEMFSDKFYENSPTSFVTIACIVWSYSTFSQGSLKDSVSIGFKDSRKVWWKADIQKWLAIIVTWKSPKFKVVNLFNLLDRVCFRFWFSLWFKLTLFSVFFVFFFSVILIKLWRRYKYCVPNIRKTRLDPENLALFDVLFKLISKLTNHSS